MELKNYRFITVSKDLSVKYHRVFLCDDKSAQSFALMLLNDNNYESVTVEEIREIIHLKGGQK